jgi:hypothetical protein
MKSLSRKNALIIGIFLLFFIIFFVTEYKLRSLHEASETLIQVKPKIVSLPEPTIVRVPVQNEKELDNPRQQSKHAYITLLSGINPDFTHRGFLYNVLIMKQMLVKLGSNADFIVMIGYKIDPTRGNDQKDLYIPELNLLKKNQIIIYELPRYLSSSKFQLNFAEMALLKVTPFLLTQYEKIQYFDGDIMPTKNLDCFFELQQNAFTIGAVSPLNSGWFLIQPNLQIYRYFQEKAIWRLTRDWDKVNGWGHPFPRKVFYTRGKHKETTLWDFNGADMDQGLFLYFFTFFYGNIVLIDTELKQVYYYEKGMYSEQFLEFLSQKQEEKVISAQQLASAGDNPNMNMGGGEEGGTRNLEKGLANYLKEKESNSEQPLRLPYTMIPMKEALSVCEGGIPTDYFLHFTGQSKPWILSKNEDEEKKRNNWGVKKWLKELDELELKEINSSNIYEKKLGAPLGFFNANFPKGGYKDEEKKSRS